MRHLLSPFCEIERRIKAKVLGGVCPNLGIPFNLAKNSRMRLLDVQNVNDPEDSVYNSRLTFITIKECIVEKKNITMYRREPKDKKERRDEHAPARR